MSTTASTSLNISRWRRTGYAALSGLAGWLASQLACLPLNLITAVRDSEGQPHLFVQTLLYGLLVWGGWTLLLAFAAWLLVALPLVMTIRPCLLVRLRGVILTIAILAAAAATASRLTVYRDPAGISRWQRFAQLLPYGGFGLTFAVVTAWVYIVLSKRRLDRAAAV